MAKYLTRRGDGALIEMTSEAIMGDFEAGTADAADRGKIAPLSQDDLETLQDIFTDRNRFVSVGTGERSGRHPRYRHLAVDGRSGQQRCRHTFEQGAGHPGP